MLLTLTEYKGSRPLNLLKAFWPCPSGRELFLETCACVVRHYFNLFGLAQAEENYFLEACACVVRHYFNLFGLAQAEENYFLEACACVERHYFNRSGNPVTAGKARSLTSLLPGTPPAIQKEMPKITPSLPPIRGGLW
jgi:hypothetical protein